LSTEFQTGVPVNVDRGQVPVRRVLCGNASPLTGPGTNSYLIGTQSLALIDPGPADPLHMEAILKAAGDRPIRWIFVTHTHGDHSPGAAVLRERTGADLIGLAAPQAGYQDDSFVPDRLFADGERIDCGEFVLRLVHTPGHVSNHFCFLLEQENMLFTGDHILQGTTSVILPPDGNMADYMNSLAVLRTLPLAALAPGHGAVMDDPDQVIDTLVRHRMRREQKVVAALESLGAVDGAVDIDTLVLSVYDDVAEHLLPWAKKTLLAHLIKLQGEQRASCQDHRWQLT
jgi:glyoxylase-like metal-dependent hydrolase (beta-lactamase superfamily II)